MFNSRSSANKNGVAAYAPFHLFSAFADNVQLDDNKYHFKIYSRSFTGETAQISLMTMAACSRAEAFDCIQRFLEGQLIYDCEKSTKEQEVKTKKVYGITSKGELIARDFRQGRLSASPEQTISANDKTLTTNIIYWDRDVVEGNLMVSPIVAEVAFKLFLGDKPSRTAESTSPTTPSPTASETTPGLRSRNNSLSSIPSMAADSIFPIRSISVKDRLMRLKVCTHTFTGESVVDWILRNTSVLNRDEATTVGSYFLAQGWIQNLNDSNNQEYLKDVKYHIYQPTIAGASLAGWNLETDTPTVGSAVKELIKKMSMDGSDMSDAIDERKKSADGTEAMHPLKVNTASATSSRTSGTRISQENLSKFETILKKSRENVAEGADAPDSEGIYEWEICHNYLISMDGTQAKSKASRYSSLPPGEVSPTRSQESKASSPTKAKRVSLSNMSDGGNPFSNPKDNRSSVTPGSKRTSGNTNLMAPALKRDPLVDSIKDSNPVRLVQILDNLDLRSAFELCVKSMYCEENFHFWLDVNAFRTLYSGCAVIPGEELNPDNVSKDISPMLIPHAIALYLKYIIHDAPFELNIVSSMKKKINNVMANAPKELFDKILPEAISLDEVIVPSKIVKGGQEGLQQFPTELPGFSATLFDVVEKHIFGLMASDSVPKFIKTGLYHDIMLQLLTTGRLIKRIDEGSYESRRRSEIQKRNSESNVQSGASSRGRNSVSSDVAVPANPASNETTNAAAAAVKAKRKSSAAKRASLREEAAARNENSNSGEGVVKEGALTEEPAQMEGDGGEDSKAQAQQAAAQVEATKERMMQGSRDGQAF
ncbi:hypothetical protein HDV05_005373 [Chytridiales sp. JEL 0842]|nr:hypothetical protein HDV05_005373 [Chytridiales sp. JEL 0842]